jgi:SAM-dependent methyltransferase
VTDTGQEPDLPAHWFQRIDESADEVFYAAPRFVAHIDEATLEALTDFYDAFVPEGCDVLDLMSSWISHLPPKRRYRRVAGLGMNAAELQANPQLTDHVVHNLNAQPQLPYPDGSFDRVLVAVSVQYLVRPVDVLTSARRTLREHGMICIAMSHRLFPTKAILAFHELRPADRVKLVGRYLQGAGFSAITFNDRSPPDADPLWLVTATR